MAYLIGTIFGALVAMLLISRLTLWLAKKVLGDTYGRIWLAHAAAIIIAVGVGSWSFSNGGALAFGSTAITYVPAGLVWLVIDLLGLKGRRATLRSFD